jgi:hypothetical protein
MEMEDDYDLIGLSQELRCRHGLKAPSYTQLWRGAVDGQFPARRVRRFWRVSKDDIPLIEAHFELTAPATPNAA